jgi:hypothetical protein
VHCQAPRSEPCPACPTSLTHCLLHSAAEQDLKTGNIEGSAQDTPMKGEQPCRLRTQAAAG